MATTLLLHAQHHGTDVLYQPFGPWIVPWRFTSHEAEYRTLRINAGLIDYSTQALIHVQGTDRASFLQNVLTNEIKRLVPGSGCQAALLTANATLIAPLLVLADSDAFWLLCDLERAKVVCQTLEQYLFSEQVTLTNHERRYAVLALQGPRAIAILSELVRSPLSLPHAGDHLTHALEHIPIRLVRHTLDGDPGVLCVLDRDHAVELWEWLKQRGARLGVSPVGWEALNTARIEAGIPWWGVDMDETNLLPETGLDATMVSNSKGCYLGQEILARLSTYGSVSKKLMGLLIQGGQVPAIRDAIVQHGETVGTITSACVSPIRKQPIAMGYLKRGAYTLGTPVEVLHDTTTLHATVTHPASLSREDPN